MEFTLCKTLATSLITYKPPVNHQQIGKSHINMEEESLLLLYVLGTSWQRHVQIVQVREWQHQKSRHEQNQSSSVCSVLSDSLLDGVCALKCWIYFILFFKLHYCKVWFT